MDAAQQHSLLQCVHGIAVVELFILSYYILSASHLILMCISENRSNHWATARSLSVMKKLTYNGSITQNMHTHANK